MNALNPFENKQQLAHVAQTGAAREESEVQSMMVIAKRFPRDPVQAVDRILQACTRQSLAEGAMYSYNRGGSEVTGPSIRLAEAMAQAWGNLQCGLRELEQRDGESSVEASAWDLETNTRYVKVFQVRHERHTRQGVKKLTDPRDVYELVANQGSRRLRACILAAIPGDVTEAAVQQCEVTLAAQADTSPKGVKKLTDAFSKLGVSTDAIVKRLGNRLDAIRPAQILQLRKIYTSIKDGMSASGDWFETAPEKPAINEALEKAAKSAKAKKVAEPESFEMTPPEPVDQILAGIARVNPEDAETWLEEAREQGLSAEDMARVEAAIEARKAS
ncbi:MAG: hypothetical protein EOM21_18800 [Gammaproteobacteria bacterium]|nr:hypothetical protein [Gammaproteobacteria bacterium]